MQLNLNEPIRFGSESKNSKLLPLFQFIYQLGCGQEVEKVRYTRAEIDMEVYYKEKDTLKSDKLIKRLLVEKTG
jgi:hypothetical protein